MNSFNISPSGIFINGRFLTQQTSGVQAFARGICKELIAAVPGLTILVPAGTGVVSPEFAGNILETGNLKGHFWEQFHLPRYMKSHPGAVLINLCNTAPLRITNQVVTVHDLAFIKNPGWFHPAFSAWYKFMIPRLLKNSRVVMTVSETIKQEMKNARLADENKIIVAGNKVSEELLNVTETAPAEKRIQGTDFFLMVGSADPRKNFGFVEQFFADTQPPFKLVIAGGANKNFRNAQQVQSDQIIRLGYTTAGELKWLYRHAAAFINPSLYEGFGIPNLEAMSLGCPVICSDIPVFREICGESVYYFELKNSDSLSRCIQQVLQNKMLTETKTSEGKVIFTQIQARDRISKLLKALF